MDAKALLQLLLVLVLVQGPNVTTVRLVDAADQWPSKWGYEGSGAAAFWDDLNPENYSLCGAGHQQSPIDLGNDNETKGSIVEKPADAIVINWSNATNFTGTGLILKNLGHTVEVQDAFGDNYTTEYLNETFKLLQFHFHAPSEHHVNGDFAPLEVHFVHKTDGGKLAVLGIMMDIANNSDAKSQFMADLVPLLSDVRATNSSVNMTKLDLQQALAEANGLAQGFWTYNGSLTTPPCTEGVNWVVAKDRIKISGRQFNTFRSVIKYSARPTQQRDFPPQDSPKAARPLAAAPLTAGIAMAVLAAVASLPLALLL